jgi:hypothetical protein
MHDKARSKSPRRQEGDSIAGLQVSFCTRCYPSNDPASFETELIGFAEEAKRYEDVLSYHPLIMY